MSSKLSIAIRAAIEGGPVFDVVRNREIEAFEVVNVDLPTDADRNQPESINLGRTDAIESMVFLVESAAAASPATAIFTFGDFEPLPVPDPIPDDADGIFELNGVLQFDGKNVIKKLGNVAKISFINTTTDTVQTEGEEDREEPKEATIRVLVVRDASDPSDT